MTIDEHMFLTYALMNVRDEVQDLARRDDNLRAYVTDLDDCLAVLNRISLRHELTPSGKERDAHRPPDQTDARPADGDLQRRGAGAPAQ
jgi:hypothetical protein